MSSQVISIANLDPVWQDVCLSGMQVMLARTPQDIRAAQKLRYEVFYEEMGAIPSPETEKNKYDGDAIDDHCDHLLVVDTNNNNNVIATYRLLRREKAKNLGRFYTASEYNIKPIIDFDGNILELGRSCVAKNHRTKPTMKLLWRGLGTYINLYSIDLMFGCASLAGTNPDDHAKALTYLYHNHLAPKEIRPRTLEDYYVNMDRCSLSDKDARRTLAQLPPLIKAYLRVGGFVGDGAYIDKQFNTTDVCIVVKTHLIEDRYIRQYF